MSYILEALRKAEAQRGRQRLPGLQAQPLAVATPAPARAWASPGWWGAGGLAIVLLVAAGFWWGTQESQPALAIASGQPSVAPAAGDPVAERPAAAPVQPAAPAIVPAPPPTVVPVEPARASPPAVSSSRAAVEPAAPVAPAPSPTAPAGAPSLAISGGVYSPNPAQRMLIVNGQVFNEGSEVAPGVTLEQVKPNQAVLNFRGDRYTVRY